ncbi:hypothetical protein B0H14DRAFT_2630068 [Mycena olivaceomarginata]|nr:hypothetical protein B0H14DRAFT_2630068 [Mycena olivaceomarginata]
MHAPVFRPSQRLNVANGTWSASWSTQETFENGHRNISQTFAENISLKRSYQSEKWAAQVAAHKAVEQQAEATRKEEENKPAAEAAKRAEERLEAEKKKPKFGDHECARESPNREAWSIAAAYGEYSTMEGRRLEENKRNRSEHAAERAKPHVM